MEHDRVAIGWSGGDRLCRNGAGCARLVGQDDGLLKDLFGDWCHQTRNGIGTTARTPGDHAVDRTIRIVCSTGETSRHESCHQNQF